MLDNQPPNDSARAPKGPLFAQPVLAHPPARNTRSFGLSRHEIKRKCVCGLCLPEEFVNSEKVTQRLLEGRTLVLVDHENLIEGPSASVDRSAWAWHCLKDALMITPEDSVVIGLSKYSFRRFMTSLPLNQVQVVVGDGPDGADHALINAVDVASVAQRYDQVVIASGDHIFAGLAHELREAGIRVVNAFPENHGSMALRRSANFTMRLRGLSGNVGRKLEYVHPGVHRGLKPMALAA